MSRQFPPHKNAFTLRVERDMHNIIISANPMLAYGLSALIKTHFPECKISTISSIQEALERKTTPDKLPTTSIKLDLFFLDQINLESPNVYKIATSVDQISAVIAFDIHSQAGIRLCQKYAIDDFILRNNGIDYMIDAIQRIGCRHQFLQAEKLPLLIKVDVPFTFTDRQNDLADLLLRGHSNKEMAHYLNLSYGTVKNYMFALMRLTSVRSRLELAIKLREINYQIRDSCHAKIGSN